MNHDNERKAFDAYFKEKYPELYKDVFDEDGDDRAIIGYSFALKAWLSSANREGYKLAPLEPSQEMLIAADNCEIDGKVTAHNIYKAMIGSCDSN